MKKILLVILIFALALTGIYADTPSSWAQEAISDLQDLGHFKNEVFSDYQEDLSRGDFIYIAVRVYEILSGEEIVIDPDISFSDTDDLYALKGASVGITSGVGQGRFGYTSILTREQLATLMIRVLTLLDIDMKPLSQETFSDDALISAWAKEAIYLARSNKIISGIGDNRVNPQGTATKETALIIANTILNEKNHLFAQRPDGQIIRIDISQSPQMPSAHNDRPYDWYIDQANTGTHSNDNCGPSSSVMAAKWQDVHFKDSPQDARSDYRPSGGWWYTSDVENYLDDQSVDYYVDGFDGTYELVKALDDGDIILVCINTSYLSYTPFSPTGKFYTYSGGHFLIIKGYEYLDQVLYFEVYDPNNWNLTNPDGSPMGKDRLYPGSEMEASIDHWWDFYIVIE